MDHIIEINRRSVFSLEEAQELLPVVFRITKAYKQKVEALIGRIDGISSPVSGVSVTSLEDLTNSLEIQVNGLVQEWQNKVQKLGALPKGLWIADFDSGDGYFCWRFPERGIEYWHKYNDGFSKRVRVSERHAPIPLAERIRNKIMPPALAPSHPSIIK